MFSGSTQASIVVSGILFFFFRLVYLCDYEASRRARGLPYECIDDGINSAGNFLGRLIKDSKFLPVQSKERRLLVRFRVEYSHRGDVIMSSKIKLIGSGRAWPKVRG